MRGLEAVLLPAGVGDKDGLGPSVLAGILELPVCDLW